METNWSRILENKVWIEVELAMKVPATLRPLGGMSHTAVLMLLGIHSTKYSLFLSCIPVTCSSTSFMETLPLNTAATVRNLPSLKSQAAIMLLGLNIWEMSWGTVRLL